jgi:hypothetical protein
MFVTVSLPISRGMVGSSWSYLHIEVYVRIKSIVNIRTALDVAQLVKDDYFTLFESIGAIEVIHICCQAISPY